MMAITVRVGPEPGDLGTVLAMHGRVYAAEYGYDEGFEAHVASGIARFATALGEARENPGAEPGWLWIAEDDGDVVGTIALTVEDDGVGQIRWFLVEPGARGGLGRRLLDAALDKARSAGMARVRLWTVDGLDAAAHLYKSMGFARTQEVPGHRFGQDLVEARYDLEL
jgi:N-acetylglutamate synthase-like GNAT family acetyltransferase